MIPARNSIDDRPASHRRSLATRRSVLASTAAAGLASPFATAGAAQQNETTEQGDSTTDQSSDAEAAGSSAASDSTGEQRVVSYYTGWSRYDRDFQPADVPLGKIDDLNYAFLTVKQDGTVDYADPWGDEENLSAFRDLKADHPDTRCFLSIGGWSDSTYFSDAAATQANRERFASTAIEIVREYDFDGIDVDWEYPGGGGAEGNVTRPEDPENFALLLEEVRSQLDAAEAEDGAEYGLTIAASANASRAGTLPIADLAPLLDYVTVMSYDFAGGWSDATGHNAPLYADAEGESSVASAMQWWAEQPIPREQLCVGVPFYGRSFAGVEGVDGDGGDGAALGQPFSNDGSVRYRTIDDEYPTTDDGGSYQEFWDDTAKVPYRYSSEASTFLSYDDAESIAAKAEFAAAEEFGGVMVWEQAGDPDGTFLDVVHEHLGDDPETAPDDSESAPDACASADATVEVDGRTVCDVDGDGLYRDLNLDGDASHADVQAFFSVQHRPAWKRPELFDFNGNEVVGHGDVVALFEDVATGSL